MPHDPQPRPFSLNLVSSPPLPSGTAIDPVCGMTVDPAHAAASWQYQGKTYYFCCSHSHERFRNDPRRFLEGGAKEEMPSEPGQVEYFCPMDPDVVSDHPGACPKCGMALEPRTITLEEGPNPEAVDMRRRFWI